jgi:serine/threonine-protein kinase RsbW
MGVPTFTLTTPSESRMLSVARGFVEAVCEISHLDRCVTHALIIVTGEAVTNIIRHAHRHRENAQMVLRLQLYPDCVVLAFEDQGDPFDLDSVPVLPPGEVRIGGRGIYLMRTLMDELSYQPRDQGEPGNVLRMVKRCAVGSGLRECG